MNKEVSGPLFTSCNMINGDLTEELGVGTPPGCLIVLHINKSIDQPPRDVNLILNAICNTIGKRIGMTGTVYRGEYEEVVHNSKYGLISWKYRSVDRVVYL